MWFVGDVPYVPELLLCANVRPIAQRQLVQSRWEVVINLVLRVWGRNAQLIKIGPYTAVVIARWTQHLWCIKGEINREPSKGRCHRAECYRRRRACYPCGSEEHKFT